MTSASPVSPAPKKGHAPRSAHAPTVFVAGATGYTGSALVAQLCAAGVRTIAHVRPDSPRLTAHRARLEALGALVDTTPFSPRAMGMRFAALKPTHIFALLGTTKARARALRNAGRSAQKETYDAVDYGLTATLIQACGVSDVRPRFIYLSAMGVKPGVQNAYLAARAALEQDLSESGLPHLVVRPGLISGADRAEARPMERTGAVLAHGMARVLSGLGARHTGALLEPLDADTLAAGMIALALRPEFETGEANPADLRAALALP